MKGAGLDHVAADGEERLVDALDDVRPRQNQMVVASLERLSAEVLGGEMVPLDVRAHGAVEHEHAFVERIEVGGLDGAIRHTRYEKK